MFHSQRISIIGTSGCGKTTLARQLCQHLAIPHIELDALHWEANWTEVPTNIFRQRVGQSLKCDRWIVDGNYSQVRDIIWSRADTVIWLDYSLFVIMTRLLRRTWRRVVQHEELWNGNRETWTLTFSRESILLWALQTYQKRRQEYPILLTQSAYAHLNLVHLKSPKETYTWLSTLAI